jgi:drug/metabolite transporter (DMT)-like permease
VLWSATFAFARSLSEQVGPLTAGAAAYLIGGASCLLRLGLKPEPIARFRQMPKVYLFGCGALFIFYTATLYVAVGLAKSREQLLEIALVNYLWPSFTVLGSVILLKKRASFWLAPGTVLALAGVFLVVTQGAAITWISIKEHLSSNPVAYFLALGAAVSWGVYSNLTRRWTGPGTEGAVELFMPVTGLVLLGMRLVITEPVGWNARAVGEAVGLAAVTTLAYYLWDISMRKGNLRLVVAGSYLTPLLSTGVSCAYLQVTPGPRLWVGCLLLVTGSVVTWRSLSEEVAVPEQNGVHKN